MYFENKAAVYYLEQGLCQLCGDDNDGQEMRQCMRCERNSCAFCMRRDRLCCIFCPATDDICATDLGSRCQKCAWTYDDMNCLKRCGQCRLALCQWCCRADIDACRRNCPHFSHTTSTQVRSPVLHRYAASYADKAEHAWHHATALSSRVGAVKPYTGIERMLHLLGRDQSSSSV